MSAGSETGQSPKREGSPLVPGILLCTNACVTQEEASPTFTLIKGDSEAK